MNNKKMPQIDHAGLAERLEILRTVIGLDKGEFSLSFGVDPSSYTKIINGTKPLKADAAYALSERWGVSMDFLYRGSLDKLPDRYAKAVIDQLTKR